ncbi:MAG: hypothetical protein FD161_3328 [Limisphaerales bacterium]|nr:MAG: hypothetical protein FD161_3328 [Limisphaerales bacterium]KAG0507843.1 MAG: hypothetical protein E1N63_2994 [Limisphaerales bacterium]
MKTTAPSHCAAVPACRTTAPRSLPARLKQLTLTAAAALALVALLPAAPSVNAAAGGTVVAWGLNGDGQTTVPASLSGVTAIAAGQQHTVALRSDGTVVAWGYNGFGQTTVPAGLSGVTAIAAGVYHTVALRSDGSVVAWGYNGLGQTTVPAGLSGVTAIAAGFLHTVALTAPADSTPPVLALPGNSVVEATSPAGATATYTASATDDVDGSVAVTLNPASGSTFPLGTTTVNASATDAAGNPATGSFTVTVRDTTAPVITSLTASTAVLWPPNHKMVSVTVSGAATEAVSEVTGRILSVTSNEPDNGLGDGDTAGDIVITGNGTVSLRAERSGKGNGRIYTILFEASDAAGNTSTSTVTVSVPKSQGK